MLFSEKIVFGMLLVTIFAYMIPVSIEIFIIIILVGALVIREITDIISPVKLKDKIDMFIYAGLIIFIWIIIKKIVYIMS